MKKTFLITMILLVFFCASSVSYAAETDDGQADVSDSRQTEASEQQENKDTESNKDEQEKPDSTELESSKPEVKPESNEPEMEPEPAIVPVKDIELDSYESALYVDDTLSLCAHILPEDATEQTITYRSSNKKVATVSSSGEVKGIAPGQVTIQLSAGEFTKNIDLTVEVKAATVKLNSTYIILKPGETFSLSASVSPANTTNKVVSFHSLDKKVAKVSDDGLITGVSYGTTTITAATKDCTVSATVIVNENTVSTKSTSSKTKKAKASKTTYPLSVAADEYPFIDADMLKYFYETQQTLTIKGNGYQMVVDGKDIQNYNNELLTDISLAITEQGVSFCLNNGDALCGTISLKLDSVTEEERLYLYNTGKDAYQEIRTTGEQEWKLSSAGTYLLTAQNLQKANIVWWILGVVGGAAVVLLAVYIILKKQYWFW